MALDRSNYNFDDIGFDADESEDTELPADEANNHKGKKVGRPKGSGKKKPEEKVKHFSTSLPADIISALNEQAIIEERAISKIVAKAIRQYIDNYGNSNKS